MRKMLMLAAAATICLSTTAYAKSNVWCPPVKVKANSGVGNGAEGGATEANDRDPGKSGAHNQAGKNSFKPNSAASASNTSSGGMP